MKKGKRKRELCTGARAGGVATLNEEIFDDTVEDGVVVVTFEAELNEVPNGFGSFFRP